MSNVNLGVQNAYYCLGMSKMTVKDDSPQSYNLLKLPEFYEYLARVADVKFSDDEYSHFSMAKKIEMTLDLIMPYFKLKRTPVGEVDPDRGAAESDDSIDVDSLDPDLLIFDLQPVVPPVPGNELTNKTEP